MSLTHIEIDIANPSEPDRTERLTFLVDSGAVHSVVPGALLRTLGIQPHSHQTYRLANGDTIQRSRGTALFKYGERIGGADVIFGEVGDSNLLGAFTLEALGLGLNPLKRELIELPMMLA